MSRREPTAAELLAQLQRIIAKGDQPAANDAAPEIDEDAIRELARRDAEELRRARRR